MPNKIHIPYYKISNTIYAVIRDETDKVWHTTSKIFVTWDDSKIVDYVVNSTYKKGSLYAAAFPTDISSGYYTIMIFLQSGVSPDVDVDIWIGSMSSYWDKNKSELLSAASAGPITTIERAPKIQVKASEVVDTEEAPADVEVLPPGVQRTSSAKAGTLTRGSSSRVGP